MCQRDGSSHWPIDKLHSLSKLPLQIEGTTVCEQIVCYGARGSDAVWPWVFLTPHIICGIRLRRLVCDFDDLRTWGNLKQWVLWRCLTA